MNLDGKKLLVLGGKPINTYEIVKYAKDNGAYVIVTDYLHDHSKSKMIADECWDISTSEVDLLSSKVENMNIDGIYAGVHEFNLLKVKEICKKTRRPFYADDFQWEVSTNKALFKKICRDNNLPVAQDYDINRPEEIYYPVIVKPVDGSSGQGISICSNYEELSKAYKLALECSDKKEVIIEEYLYGNEIVAFYSIANGNAKLSVLTDYYYNYDQKITMPLPQVYVYPSKYLKEFIEKEDLHIKKFLKELKIQNGTFFLQAFKNEKGFFFFEPGYRPGGSSVYKYTQYLNGISYIDMLVNYSLLGNIGDYDLRKENPFFSKPCCTLSIVAKGGTIGEIKGYQDVLLIKDIIDSELRFNVGDYVRENSALRQIVMRFFIVSNTFSRIKEIINVVQSSIKVLDVNKENMLIMPFDVNRLNYED